MIIIIVTVDVLNLIIPILACWTQGTIQIRLDESGEAICYVTDNRNNCTEFHCFFLSINTFSPFILVFVIRFVTAISSQLSLLMLLSSTSAFVYVVVSLRQGTAAPLLQIYKAVSGGITARYSFVEWVRDELATGEAASMLLPRLRNICNGGDSKC